MRMKRTLALLTALAALLALTGCGVGSCYDVLSVPSDTEAAGIGRAPEIGSDPFSVSTPEPTAEPTPVPTPKPTAEPTPVPTAEPDVFGAVGDGVYTNDYFGVRCTLPEGWSFFDGEQLDTRLDDAVSNPDVDGQVSQDMDAFLASGENACVMAACADNGLKSVNVVVEYLSGLGGYISEEELIRIALHQLGADETGDLASLGLDGAVPEINTCSFAGEEHAGLRVEYTDTSLGIDVPIYLQLVCIIRGGYAMQVTMSTAFDDAPLTGIADMFTAMDE